MEYEMGLYEAPFNSMKSGRKKVEVRLNDEKEVIFTKIPGERESLIAKVTGDKEIPDF